MGCPKLNITDYFRLTATTDNQDTPILGSTSTKKTASSRFFPVVSVSIVNYRYYSPELGRWLSRDPINQVGSPAWWMDNPMRIRLQVILKRTEFFINYLNSAITKYPIVTGLINKVKDRLIEQSLSIQYFLQMDLTGNRNINNGNPYCFVKNNSIIYYDLLGTFGTMPPLINVLHNGGGGTSDSSTSTGSQSTSDGCVFYEVIIDGIILGNYFNQAGQTLSSTTPIGPGGPSPSTVGSTAGGFITIGGVVIFGIGAYITGQTAGLATLWALPFALLGGEMIIWGVQLIRGCNTPPNTQKGLEY